MTAVYGMEHSLLNLYSKNDKKMYRSGQKIMKIITIMMIIMVMMMMMMMMMTKLIVKLLFLGSQG